MTKSRFGNFFEDFSIGQVIRHSTPRTITDGDSALYTSLYGTCFAVQSSDAFAKAINFPQAPLDDLLVFHIVFGKSVPDISLNAVANLGYANGRFILPVYPGDTISTTSEVIGLKENSNGKTGIVYVHTIGFNQKKEEVVSFNRWVMVKKKTESINSTETVLPKLPEVTSPDTLCRSLPELNIENWDKELSGSSYFWNDYEIGEKIDHIDGMTVEESEHQMATRLYQNTARVHFNQFIEKNNRFGRRLIYGGHVISIARSLSFNGLANAFHIAAINGGQHVSPLFAGDTVFAWTEILDKYEIPNRSDIGLLRIRTIAAKDLECKEFPFRDTEGKYETGIILDFDYWTAIPR